MHSTHCGKRFIFKKHSKNIVEINHIPYRLHAFYLRAPSETTVYRHGYPAEARFVFKRHKTLEIVSVLIQTGPQANPAIQKILMLLDSAKPKAALAQNTINFKALLPENFSHYTFSGTEKHHHHHRAVYWHVLEQPVYASAAQLSQLEKYYAPCSHPVTQKNPKKKIYFVQQAPLNQPSAVGPAYNQEEQSTQRQSAQKVSEQPFRKNAFSHFVGVTVYKHHAGFTTGLIEYERRLNKQWGVGIALDQAINLVEKKPSSVLKSNPQPKNTSLGYNNATTGVVLAFLHPHGPFKINVGAGVERIHHVNSYFVGRVGAGMEIPLGKKHKWAISPVINMDISHNIGLAGGVALVQFF
eukprot:TRINITY_DN7443_c0_g1_i2.p1 TRINITY_DN7443_c0_g1~~TRINITY_DN7443_c0_g1_i2.p1  ORF type:complete len:354 (+),score=-71.06 TRINITY_DN7443_c0_g1_i2:424-1485(+)